MKFTVALALCFCAAQVFGLGMPNYLLTTTTFSTVPPWQYATTDPVTLTTPTFNVVPPTFTQGAKQYRRVYDEQLEAAYIPLNNYVLLSNADLSATTPRATVLALGPNVTKLDEEDLGATVAHPALSADAFGYDVTLSQFNPEDWVINTTDSYVWTGASLDWNMFALSSYDQVLDSARLRSLNFADQFVGGTFHAVPLIFTDDDYVVTADGYPQRWIRTSPQNDGLYFVKDTEILGIVSVQNGAQDLFAKGRKTHIAYGGYRPNHLLNSGCDRQNRILPSDPFPAFFGKCP